MRHLAVCVFLVVACGGDDEALPADADAGATDARAEPAPDADTRTSLADTGLYDGPLGGALAPGVLEYEVAWELWADGAAKRRFVLLPDGAVIDSSSMDFWTYPVGTKIWKEFAVAGTPVETRLIEKRGPGDWLAVSFAWNQDGTDARAVEDGAEDALGTDHDIPSANDCRRCHSHQPDFVLGFSALQLDHAPGEVTLSTLAEAGLLSDPPAGAAPYYPLPGDEAAQAALGYLHGNCGGCHHEGSAIHDLTSASFRLAVGALATVEDTPTYQSAVNQSEDRPLGGEVTAIIEPGDHAASAVWVRMGLRGPMQSMPPLASDEVDEVGHAAMAAWIDSLPPQ